MKTKTYSLLFITFSSLTLLFLIISAFCSGSTQAFTTCTASIFGGGAASVGVAWIIDKAIERDANEKQKRIGYYFTRPFYRSVFIYMDSICRLVVSNTMISAQESHTFEEWTALLSSQNSISNSSTIDPSTWMPLITECGKNITTAQVSLVAAEYLDTSEIDSIDLLSQSVDIVYSGSKDTLFTGSTESYDTLNILHDAMLTELSKKYPHIRNITYSKERSLLSQMDN